jgi:hypothetical protein
MTGLIHNGGSAEQWHPPVVSFGTAQYVLAPHGESHDCETVTPPSGKETEKPGLWEYGTWSKSRDKTAE